MESATTPQTVAKLRLESERRLAVTITSLMLVPGVVFAYVDANVVVDPLKLHLIEGLRAVQLSLWIVGLVLIRRARSRETLRRLLFGLALTVVFFLVTHAWLRPADNWMPLRTFVMVSIATFVVYPYQFRNQLIAWLALLVAAASLMWGHYAAMPSVDRVAAALNILIAGALGMAVARNRLKLERDLDEALERERQAVEDRQRTAAALRTLEGIIPICMYCREVRTEAGAWEKLDDYVRSRTDADFSHGICPVCLSRNFPERA